MAKRIIFEDLCNIKHSMTKQTGSVRIDASQTSFERSMYERCLYSIDEQLSEGCGIDVTDEDISACVINREVWLVVDYGVSWHHDYMLYKPIGFTI